MCNNTIKEFLSKYIIIESDEYLTNFEIRVYNIKDRNSSAICYDIVNDNFYPNFCPCTNLIENINKDWKVYKRKYKLKQC